MIKTNREIGRRAPLKTGATTWETRRQQGEEIGKTFKQYALRAMRERIRTR